MSATTQSDLKTQIVHRAMSLGFDAVGITSPTLVGNAGENLSTFVSTGRNGDMNWLEQTLTRRQHPRALMPEVQSIIMLAMRYTPDRDPLEDLSHSERGIISVYAKGHDYHGIIKGRLKEIAGLIATRAGHDVKVFVDTAPVMEKPLAAAAGIGWQGKHTNLVSTKDGSWLFLGAIFTTAEIAPDIPEVDHCGSCQRCLDVCPTDAFPAPYQLDARRCIAYLTNEYHGHIPREFRTAIGNRIFGCDDCLAVCPWNKFAAHASETKFHARVETDNPPLVELLVLDDAAFRKRFAGTPVKRTGRDRFIRNVLIAAGNSKQPNLTEQVHPLLNDTSPLVRAMAVWALHNLCDSDEFTKLSAAHLFQERDDDVRAEWQVEERPLEDPR